MNKLVIKLALLAVVVAGAFVSYKYVVGQQSKPTVAQGKETNKQVTQGGNARVTSHTTSNQQGKTGQSKPDKNRAPITKNSDSGGDLFK